MDTLNETVPDTSDHREAVPSYGQIFRFYFPLALSWIFMALEAPITTTVASRTAAPEIQTAALLMLGGLSLWIESPVIDLLATSTTLAKDARSYAIISRFVWWVMGWCTLLHAAIALTPLYDAVAGGLLGVPEPVLEAARLPMAVMIPWSAFIGWRRYLQGILIRHGRTRIIGVGTAVRVVTMAGVSAGLFFASNESGIMIAAIALVSSVIAEALFIHVASRETIRERFTAPEVQRDSGDEPLTMGRLLRFHLPLTVTTMTFLASLPMVSAAIARAPDGLSAMAGWQVATSFIFLHRTVVFALPEPVIALYRGPHSAARLARFCLLVGSVASGVMAASSLTGIDKLVFGRLFGAPEGVVPAASLAFLACVALPFLGAVQSYLRAMLTAHHVTVARFTAVLASTSVLIASLWFGVDRMWTGVAVAAVALNISSLAELAALAFSWSRVRRQGSVASPSRA